MVSEMKHFPLDTQTYFLGRQCDLEITIVFLVSKYRLGDGSIHNQTNPDSCVT